MHHDMMGGLAPALADDHQEWWWLFKFKGNVCPRMTTRTRGFPCLGPKPHAFESRAMCLAKQQQKQKKTLAIWGQNGQQRNRVE